MNTELDTKSNTNDTGGIAQNKKVEISEELFLRLLENEKNKVKELEPEKKKEIEQDQLYFEELKKKEAFESEHRQTRKRDLTSAEAEVEMRKLINALMYYEEQGMPEVLIPQDTWGSDYDNFRFLMNNSHFLNPEGIPLEKWVQGHFYFLKNRFTNSNNIKKFYIGDPKQEER